MIKLPHLLALAALTSTPVFADDNFLVDDFAPRPVASSIWNGFYAGVVGGAGKGAANSAPANIDITGGTIGLRVGYDMQAENIVFGAMITADKSYLGGLATCSSPTSTCSGEFQYLARAEARVGYAFDGALVYAKGGAAYGYARTDTTTSGLDHYINALGWTIGGGMEVSVADNISVFAEYAYFGFPTYNAPAPTGAVDAHLHLVQGGINYHF